MKIFRIFRSLRSKSNFRKYFSNFTYAVPVRLTNINNHVTRTSLYHHNIGRYSTENDDETEQYSLLETETLDVMEQTKYLLFRDPKDSVINELNGCCSLEDVWSILNKYKTDLNDEQITQSVLVLKDLQKSFCKVNCTSTNPSLEFLKKVESSKEFENLMNKLTDNIEHFNTEFLSYVFLYLQRLGINIEDRFMVQIAEKLKDDLEKNFDLSICGRFMRVIFLENSVRPYYMSLNLIPKVLQALNKCDSIEDLSNISVCLNKLQNMVTPSVLKKYTDVVESFLNNKKLDVSHHNTILKVITFLCVPYWREENVELMSKCMLLLKNGINRLDVPYLLLLYEVFFKIQEPGDLLNEIQRSAAKFWQQFEENGMMEINAALKLFSALLFFSSPLHRVQLRKDVEKLLKTNMDLRNLIIIRKIFSYVKISNKNLCRSYWDIWSKTLKEQPDHYLIVKSCLNYMKFNIDIDNYRNLQLERQVLELIKNVVRQGDLILPQNLGIFLAFVIYYGNDDSLLKVLLNKLKQNPRQLTSTEILILSQTFNARSNFCTEENFAEISSILNEGTEYLFSLNKSHSENNSILIKAAIMRFSYDNHFIDDLMIQLKELDFMSSKLMENICFMFLSTNTLIPEVFNKITEYIVKNKNNIIGFNAEKVLFLCFHLAYYPINADKFFQAVTDIIIRDQERLSGLAFLQSALSLSFFNKLPSFLVKQIFNVEFMDRLDNELANCYSKEKYPQRVRHTLMYLNRTVCLEYPEFNIPWFHEKYVKDIPNQFLDVEHNLLNSIKEYLSEITSEDVLENVVTPYGYHIDFVVNLDNENKVVSPKSDAITKRVALLLIKHYAYTRFYAHLRGTYQMKIKHLEIMGYNVSIIKFDEWTNLLYTTERMDYLKKMIWPDNYDVMWATKR